MLLRLRDRTDDEVFAEGLPGECARRATLQGRQSHPRFDQRFQAVTLDRMFAAGIDAFPSAGQMAHETVE